MLVAEKKIHGVDFMLYNLWLFPIVLFPQLVSKCRSFVLSIWSFIMRM